MAVRSLSVASTLAVLMIGALSLSACDTSETGAETAPASSVAAESAPANAALDALSPRDLTLRAIECGSTIRGGRRIGEYLPADLVARLQAAPDIALRDLVRTGRSLDITSDQHNEAQVSGPQLPQTAEAVTPEYLAHLTECVEINDRMIALIAETAPAAS